MRRSRFDYDVAIAPTFAGATGIAVGRRGHLNEDRCAGALSERVRSSRMGHNPRQCAAKCAMSFASNAARQCDRPTATAKSSWTKGLPFLGGRTKDLMSATLGDVPRNQAWPTLDCKSTKSSCRAISYVAVAIPVPRVRYSRPNGGFFVTHATRANVHNWLLASLSPKDFDRWARY